MRIAAASMIVSAKLCKDGGLCTDGGILWNTGRPAIYVGLRNGILTFSTHAVYTASSNGTVQPVRRGVHSRVRQYPISCSKRE